MIISNNKLIFGQKILRDTNNKKCKRKLLVIKEKCNTKKN